MNLGEKPVEVLKNLEMGSEKPWKYQNPEQALGVGVGKGFICSSHHI